MKEVVSFLWQFIKSSMVLMFFFCCFWSFLNFSSFTSSVNLCISFFTEIASKRFWLFINLFNIQFVSVWSSIILVYLSATSLKGKESLSFFSCFFLIFIKCFNWALLLLISWFYICSVIFFVEHEGFVWTRYNS